MPLCIYCRSFYCPEGGPCGICAMYLDELKEAHRVFLRLITGNTWFGRLIRDEQQEVHFSLRLIGWLDIHPDADISLDVLCGIHLYNDRIRTFYQIYTEDETLEIEYGDLIPLPVDDEFDWTVFQGTIHRRFLQAAETAYEDGWRECDFCGLHANLSAPHDHSNVYNPETGE